MLALLLLLLPCLAWAQPDTLWSRNFQLEGRCYLYDVTQASEDIVVACGYRAPTGSSTNWDYLMAAYSLDGDSLWARTYLETETEESLEGIITLAEDTVVAVGYGQGGYAVSMLALRASTGELLWNRSYAPSGGGRTKARDIVKLADGRFAVAGYRLLGTSSDAWILLCEANGDTVWTRNFGGQGTDIANGILQLESGNLVVGGISRASNFSDWDQWTFEVDLNGNQVGNGLTFNGGDDDFCYSVARDPLSNYWLIGRSGTDVNGIGVVTVLPPDDAPSTLIFSSPGFSDQFRSGIAWFDGMLFVGRSGTSVTRSSFYMRAINDQHESIWTWRFGTLGTDGGLNNIAQLSDGGAIACGTMIAPEDTTSIRGYFLRVLPPAGVQGRVTGLSDGEPVPGARVFAAGQDRYTITDIEGRYRLELAPGQYDVVVTGACIESDTAYGVTIAENGLSDHDFTPGQAELTDLQSSINVIAPNHESGSATLILQNSGTGALSFSLEAVGVAPTGSWMSVSPAEGVVPVGEEAVIQVIVEADTTDDGVYDFFGHVVVHTNSCPDTVIAVPVLATILDTETPATLPNEFSLSPAFPNPFNSSTTLTLALPQETTLRLEVFNVQGRLVETLAASRYSAGNHTINIDLSGSATGVYLLRAEALGAVVTQKLLYLR
ncbi:MAG: carboxypeptidase regulatory-like domain-containing protein [Calditrichaeota bacterium]|nr:carboxypeptidase regulatory-like domain-containing protein [Calditrichota bacterium]MCB9365636.1 carboxypeptidase regulatory-like domain-containing protein [Calditrichota bacterium]